MGTVAQIRAFLVLMLFSMSTLLAGPRAGATESLAHVNTDKVASLLPEYAQAKKALEDFDKQLTSQMEDLQKNFDSKSKAYTAQEKELTDPERALRIGEIRELQARIEQFSVTALQSHQLKENELLRPIIAKAQQIIGEVAKEQGIVYVFDISQGNIVYYDDARDLMPLIKKKLGLR